MEDIIVNSFKSNLVLPAKKMDRPKAAENNTETNSKKSGSNEITARKERINIDLEKTVEKVKEIAKEYTTKLAFSVDPKSKEAVIYVTNKESGKIIRQIPPEDIQKINKRMDEIVGILFSGRV